MKSSEICQYCLAHRIKEAWKEYQAEEWRRTCALSYEDILRICSLSSFVDSMTTVWKRMDESL